MNLDFRALSCFRPVSVGRMDLIILLSIILLHFDLVKLDESPARREVNEICLIESTTIDKNFQADLTEAKRIKFQFAHFESFAMNESRFEKINRIDITNCTGLKSLKSVLLGMKVNTVIIESSDVEVVDEDFLSKMRYLITLKMNRNSIKSIHKNAFKDLQRIERIELNANQISRLDDDTFAACEKLCVLQLESNELTQISSALLSKNLKLDELLLGNNEILAIEAGFPKKLKYLEKLELSGNICISENFTIAQSAKLNSISNKLSKCARSFEIIKDASKANEELLRHVNINVSEVINDITSHLEESLRIRTEEAVGKIRYDYNLHESIRNDEPVQNPEHDESLYLRIEAIESDLRSLIGNSSSTVKSVAVHPQTSCWPICLVTSAVAIFLAVLTVSLAYRKLVKSPRPHSPVITPAPDSKV